MVENRRIMEEKELTFHPNANIRSKPRPVLASFMPNNIEKRLKERADPHRSVISKTNVSVPGFEQSIERHKRVQREKLLQKEADEKIMLG